MAEPLLNELCRQTVAPRALPGGVDRRKPENLSGACERLANLQLWRANAEPEGGIETPADIAEKRLR